jgi:parallel beta-helix repeat protein
MQYSYVMSISGSNYQVLDGTTRAVLYQSTSSSKMANYLLGSSGIAAAGSSVYVEMGAYSVDATWNIYKNNVQMVFSPQAVLTRARDTSTVGSPVLWLYGNNIIISGATIDGNGFNQYPAPTTYVTGTNWHGGINIAGSNCLIQYSTIYNCRCYGIWTAWQRTADRAGVMNCVVHDCGANGISSSVGIAYATNSYFINNEVYNCGDVGIDSYGYDTIITGNYVHDCGPGVSLYGYNNAGGGISIEAGYGTSGKYIFVAGNTVSNCHDCIYVEGYGSDFHNVLISGNTLSAATWAGIRLSTVGSTSDSIIEYNNITNAQYGIYLGSGTGNTVYGNTFSRCSTNFHNGGTGTITTQPSIVAVTVTSSPTGVGFITANGVAGYAGSSSTSPYTFYATVGSSVNLVAYDVSGHTFASWSDGGAQSHIITVPSSDRTYTAYFS